jgi:uncharacterized damage-inducible protein DinB
MNERLFALAGELSEEERKRDLRAFFRSVHGTLNHLLVADRFLLGRFRGFHTASNALAIADLLDDYEPARELFREHGVLHEERRKTDRVIEAWAAELDDPLLRVELPNGQPFWFMVAHFFNHQTHHRGQLTTLFSQLGRDPGVTDLNRLPA